MTCERNLERSTANVEVERPELTRTAGQGPKHHDDRRVISDGAYWGTGRSRTGTQTTIVWFLVSTMVGRGAGRPSRDLLRICYSRRS